MAACHLEPLTIMLWLQGMPKPGEGCMETLLFLEIFVSLKLFLGKEESCKPKHNRMTYLKC